MPKRATPKKNNTVVTVLAVLLAIAAAVIVILLMKSCDGDKKKDSGPVTVIGGGEQIPDGEKEKLHGSIHLPAYTQIELEAGKKEQNVVFPNPGENNCKIIISLILDDGTVIWKSDYISPGYYSLPVTLNTALESGRYENVTMKYECFSDDGSLTPLNGAESELVLSVH